MNTRKKQEAERRAKMYQLLTWAQIIAQITMIFGFFLMIYLLIRKYL